MRRISLKLSKKCFIIESRILLEAKVWIMLEVLMIEDDLELAEIITSYLKQYDMNVTNYD